MPRLSPHRSDWAGVFMTEARAIRDVAGGAVALHHIGSTAVPDLLAKPVIDILGVADDRSAAEALARPLVASGYEAKGAYGIEGRWYFRRDDADGRRLIHLHVFVVGSPHIERHLAFRDYLRAHPDRAAAYGALKRRLARAPDYQQAKAGFVGELEAEALAWRRGVGTIG